MPASTIIRVLPPSTRQVEVGEYGLIEAAEMPKKIILNCVDFKTVVPCWSSV